jgi:hypothetical protein
MVLMLSPFTVHQAKHFGARAVEGIGVDIDVIDGIGEGVEPQAASEPIRKIVGAELQAKARGNKVEMEAGVADGGDAVTKFLEIRCGKRKGHGYIQAFAKVEAVEGFLTAELGEGVDEIAQDAAEICAESGDGSVIADVEGGELLGEGVAIGFGEGPLGEVVRETFGEEVVGAEGLIGMVEDRGVAALLEAGKEFLEISGGLIANAGEIRDGKKFEGSFSEVHSNSSWNRMGAKRLSAE